MPVDKSHFYGKSPLTLRTFIGLVPAQFNMIPSGADLTGTLWQVANTSITGSAGLGPDVRTQSQKLKENAANSEHNVSIPSGGGAGIGTQVPAIATCGTTNLPMRFAVIAKAAGRTRIVLKIRTGNFINSTASMGFDLSGGNTNYDGVHDGHFTIVGQAIRSLGGGWWLCTFDARSDAVDTQIGCDIILDNGSGTAARSTTYIGDNVSGVQIWYSSLLPMAAWTAFTKQTYFDDFNNINTIDINDTRVPGFSWYTHNRWPAWPDVSSNIPTATATPADAISVSNSILTISRDVSGYASGLMSAAVKIGNNNDFVGQVFAPPCIYEAKFALDPALSAHYGLDYFGSIPAIWSSGINGLIGLNHTQADNLMETFSGVGNYQSTIFDLTNISGHTALEIEQNIIGKEPASITDFHRVASMVLSTTTPGTNGVGCRLHFHDGIFISNTIWPWAAVGDFSILNTESKALIIGAGTEFGGALRTWPLAVDWVQILQ